MQYSVFTSATSEYCTPVYLIVLPVVRTVGRRRRGVDVVGDRPEESRVLSQSDVRPIGRLHVRAAGVEVSAQNEVLFNLNGHNYACAHCML